MPGCGTHSTPKLAEKARYNSLIITNKTKYSEVSKFEGLEYECPEQRVFQHALIGNGSMNRG